MHGGAIPAHTLPTDFYPKPRKMCKDEAALLEWKAGWRGQFPVSVSSDTAGTCTDYCCMNLEHLTIDLNIKEVVFLVFTSSRSKRGSDPSHPEDEQM